MSSIGSVVDVAAPGARRHPTERELREMFSICGRICSIHPWRGISSEKVHHFIVFEDEHSALKSMDQFRGVFHVSSLRTDPLLRERYLNVVNNAHQHRPTIPPRFPSRFHSTLHQTNGNFRNFNGKKPHTGYNLNRPRYDARQTTQTTTHRPPQPTGASLPPLRWMNTSIDGGHFSPAANPHAYTVPKPPVSSSGSSVYSICSSRPDQSSSSSLELLSPLSSKQELPPALSPRTDRQFTLNSEKENHCVVEDMRQEILAAPIDLKEEPPAKVETAVENLRRTGDKAGWMIVAAQYRRRKDLKAAEEVMAGFIDWMTERGHEFDLKPAFFFLSTLYADQAKAAASGLTASEALKDKKIMNYQRTAAHYAGIAHGMHGLRGSATRGIKRSSVYHNKESKENNDPLVPISPIVHPSRYVRGSDPPSYSSSNQIELSILRRVKRKLEDECGEERSVRRKLEDSLDQAQEELKKVKALLEFKQSQIKAEIDSRRDTVLELKRMKESAKQKEDAARWESSRKTMLDIAAQLAKAATSQSEPCTSIFFSK